MWLLNRKLCVVLELKYNLIFNEDLFFHLIDLQVCLNVEAKENNLFFFLFYLRCGAICYAVV